MVKKTGKARRRIVEADRAALKELCETDLKTFVKNAWPVVVPAEPFQDNWHVDAICEHLEWLAEGEYYDLLINVPPRFAKSTLGSVMWPSWLWVRDPTLRVISSSYAQPLSTRDSLATRRLIESPWYQSLWGDRYSITTDQNEKTRFENDKKGFRIATSVGGQATGEGGDVIIVDDPHNVNEAGSELKREEVNTWWDVTMPSRTGRAGRAMRVVIMQRVHESDLSANIIAKGNSVHLCLPMEYEANHPFTKKAWPGWSGDPRKKDGELIWPERFSEAIIAATLRPPNMTSVAYAGQFQQRPAPAEGGMFKRQWWKYYKVVPDIEKADDKCWSWDMAFKDLKTSDYVAGTGWLRIRADFYLLPHRVRDRIGFSASKAAVKSCKALFPGIHAVLVEDKANGTAILEDLHNSVGGMIAVEPKGGKEARASVMQPYAEAGNIYLPDPSIAPWIEDYIEEFRNFPNGAHDDYVDSSSQAIVWLLERAARTYDPLVWSATKSTHQPHDKYRDPRFGEETHVVDSDRGDAPRAPVKHDVNDPDHRVNCRVCRAEFRNS